MLKPEGESSLAMLRQGCVVTPSRHSNPFATCWTRPGALPFRFAEGQSAAGLVAQLAAHGWFGQIVGPHGSGKSTLLEALTPAIVAAGRHVCRLSVRAGELRADRSQAPSQPTQFDERETELSPISPRQVLRTRHDPLVVVVDGFEQLSWWRRRRWLAACRRSGAGLLVTTHAPRGLPTLIHLAPNRRLVEQLVTELCVQVSTGVTSADVADSHARHGANVRNILFDLYDRHERLSHLVRTRKRLDA